VSSDILIVIVLLLAATAIALLLGTANLDDIHHSAVCYSHHSMHFLTSRYSGVHCFSMNVKSLYGTVVHQRSCNASSYIHLGKESDNIAASHPLALASPNTHFTRVRVSIERVIV